MLKPNEYNNKEGSHQVLIYREIGYQEITECVGVESYG